MNQGEIIITYRVDSSGAITAMSNAQRRCTRKKFNSTQSNMASLTGQISFGVANTIKNLVSNAAGYRWRGHLAKNSLSIVALQTTQAMASLTGSTGGGQQAWSTVQSGTSGQHRFSRRLKKAAFYIIRLWVKRRNEKRTKTRCA